VKKPPAAVRRLVYFGTPAAAVPPLVALADAGFEIPLVVTRPDRRRSRRAAPSPSPVSAAARDLGLAVSHDVDDALDVGADLGVVVAYGQLIRPHVLDRLAMVNLHFSLLPRWRGAAPVERALLAGDEVTGVCVMALEEELDTGAIYAQREVLIGATATADELRAELVEAGTELLVTTLRTGLGSPTPQLGEPVHAHKLTAAELEIDWTDAAEVIDRWVRVGGAWTTVRHARLKIWRAALRPELTVPPGHLVDGVVGTGTHGLELVEVQPEGRSRVDATAWANGARLGPDEVLGRP